VLTDTAIRKKVQSFLNSAGDTERAQRGEPYSERDLTRAVIQFVNDCDPRAVHTLLHGFAPDRFILKDGEMRDCRPVKVDGEYAGHAEHAALRSKAHSFLCRHIDGDGENTDRALAGTTMAETVAFAAAAKRVVRVPQYLFSESARRAGKLTVTIGDLFFPESLEAAVSLGILLMLDHDKGYTDLRRCKYRQCRQFFFTSDRQALAGTTSKGGKPPSVYCCDEHFRAERTAASAEGMKKLRAERKTHKTKAKHK
jgi:hypothetical protein